MDDQITFGYWATRGKGQTGRLLLHFTGADWSNKVYSSSDAWFKDKNNIGLSFPNLPYLIDNNLKLTQSFGIFRYIISRSGSQELLGKDIQDQARVDNLTGVYEDIETGIFGLLSENYEEEKGPVLQKLKPKFGLLQQFYADKQFALGYLTLPDFLFAELAYYVRAVNPTFYAELPFLERLRKAFNDLPEIKSYY